MNPLVLFHVSAGVLALAAGGGALLFKKGSAGHRRAGLAFALTMLAMAISGSIASLGLDPEDRRINLMAAATTLYLVATGWATISPARSLVAKLDRPLCAFGFGVALVGAAFASLAASKGGPAAAGVYAIFGGVALRGAVLDLAMIMGGGIAPSRRLPRHLWRMCAAFAIAALAFFLGQQDEFPAAVRGPHWALPPLAILVAMVWWMIKLRPRAKTSG